ncbi:MAG: histidine--tRNA ligase [Calditrichaeota bacterium]|nr:MAG: histidine--tRNA ligase [Calditrichota bacterium]MBL1206300.1 histidine--tRNA ligase [Calditrichota bacterium]NOG46126.1 histidine--tRNA ligase [Calditrichota bacterium]
MAKRTIKAFSANSAPSVVNKNTLKEGKVLNPIRRIKGTQDILPDESPKWAALEQTIRQQMELFNYKEIRTPVFELTDLFARGIGELTDIVSKEMYTFQDRSKKSITLKPEMTAPVIRAYIENNLQAKAQINKLFYIASLFRQENPQAGRLRQFNQFGAEFIGNGGPEADAETISLALGIFKAIGLQGLELRINSVGDAESREPYKKILQDFLRNEISEPSEELSKRIENNPLRVLDSKDPSLQEIIGRAPKLIDHLNEASSQHYQTVKNILGAQDITFVEDTTLVRGLDYYTHTVYEITSSGIGAQNAICGGGRYDLLGQEISGKPVPAVGFAAGIERILMVLESQQKDIAKPKGLDIFIVALGGEAVAKSQNWLKKLRETGYSTDTDFLKRSMKAQFREANRQQAQFVLILGENELQKNIFSVKNMESGEQQDVAVDEVLAFLENNLAK